MIRITQRTLALYALGALLLMGMISSACIGVMPLGFARIVALFKDACGMATDVTSVERSVFWMIRAPRIALSAIIGASLASAGAALQGIFRNPLADPGLIGVSSGAALAVVSVMVFGSMLGIQQTFWLTPIAAFLGALGVTFLVLRMSTHRGVVAMDTMLLAGVAINALVGSVIGGATYLATDVQLRSWTMWTLGSLGGTNWTQTLIIAAIALPCTLALTRFAPALDLMLLGEREAGHLGIHVTRVRRTIIVLCALSVGVGVGFVGMIGFVGLVVPHVMRLIAGASHRWVLPSSACAGALLLTLADTLARTIAAPAELPIGIITSLVGGPFFLGLLLRQRRKGGRS